MKIENVDSVNFSDNPMTSPAVAFLANLLHEVSSSLRSAESLCTKGRLSNDLLEKMAAQEDLKFTMNSVIGDPAANPLYRALKFKVERIEMSGHEVANSFRTLILEIQNFRRQHPSVNTSSLLWTSNALGRKLYKQVTSTPYAPFIWKLAGFADGRSNYDYWSDDDLVNAAKVYSSFTELKKEDDRLHRHIKGRGLESALACANPSVAKHFYIGHGGVPYRSQPELVAGNYFFLRGMKHQREVSTGVTREGSDRSMTSDFLLTDAQLLLEIAQNREPNRGSRRKAYAERLDDKEERYLDAGLNVLIVNSDPFFDHGAFDVTGFATHLRSELSGRGVDIGEVPSAADLIYSDDTVKKRVLTEPVDVLLPYLRELGITNIRSLQNHFSHVHTCLKLRNDYEEITSHLIKGSSKSRSEKTSARFAAMRKEYAPITSLVSLCKEFGIRSQRQWQAFATRNRDLLKLRQLPSNPYSVYKHLGTWKNWAAIYARDGVSIGSLLRRVISKRGRDR